MGDFNLALVIVAIVVVAIVFLVNVYLLVNYQHPDDVNQAYFPKFVVVFGLSVAAISILMLPADVANRQACRHAIYNGACNLTLPMKDLWLAVYVIDAILVFFVIPFAMFYYEGDQDKSIGKRVKSALWWVVSTAIVCALVLGILYGLVGKVDFTVRHLSSSTTSFPNSWVFNSGQQCIGNGVHQCSAYSASPSSEKTWTMRSTFPEYVVALATIVGSVLFSIFGGVGIACLPLGLIFSFIRRPKAVITRSQYIKEATELGKKAKELKKAAESLHQDERSGAKGRKHRKNVKEVEKELFQLEEDVKLLEEMYPQGEKAETTWALTVLGYLANLVFGILGLIVSVAWIAHIIIYLLINPPLSPFLNEVFIKLDDIWGLLGTAAFAFFCFYLLLAVIAGATMLGLRLVFITIHPMKWGATLMNSFLFNVGLILLCSISVIQFCSTAFAYYAQATAAQEIFGHTLESLRGIKYLSPFTFSRETSLLFSPPSSSPSMAFLQDQFQQRHYQNQQQQQQQSQPQTKSFRNLRTIDGQMSQQMAFYNPTDLQDQSQHPPYIPPFHVVGFAPGPVIPADGSDGGVDLHWNFGLEPERKRLKEQDFLENNSQISSVDFLQPRSVSTGLGLSLDNTRLTSTGDSALLSLIGDDIDRELQQQDLEMDRFLKLQGEQLRQTILEKVQATQLQSVSIIEDKVLQKLREKETEVENINKRNMELEDQMEQLSVEAGAWQQRARYNENMIAALKFNLQQAYLQTRDSKEGCGDSEVDDTASCCNGRSLDFHLLPNENSNMQDMLKCKACRVNEVTMVLLPCKHLCLCKDCESKLSFCPLCQSSKFIGMEVYM